MQSAIGRRADCVEARAIVAGFALNGRFLAISTNNLSRMVDRSRSTIKSHIMRMGWKPLLEKEEVGKIQGLVLPRLRSSAAVARWTVRYAA